MLWRCWLGGRKGIRPVKSWVVGCWRGYLSGARCRFCIQPSWCHCHSLSLAPVKSRLVLPFWYWLTWVVPEKGPLSGCVCVRACVCACVCMLSNRSMHVTQTDWAPTVLVLLQPVESWRWHVLPMNVSFNWVNLLPFFSIEFMCCEEACVGCASLLPWWMFTRKDTVWNHSNYYCYF